MMKVNNMKMKITKMMKILKKPIKNLKQVERKKINNNNNKKEEDKKNKKNKHKIQDQQGNLVTHQEGILKIQWNYLQVELQEEGKNEI